MPTAKPLRNPRAPSPLVPLDAATRRATFTRPLEGEPTLIRLPQQPTAWQVLAVRTSQTMTALIARFAISGGTVFPNVVLAVLSWVAAEFLAGCAAYGKAMYCVPLDFDERAEFADRRPATPPRPSGAGRAALTVLSGHAVGGERPAVPGATKMQPARSRHAQIVELTPPLPAVDAPPQLRLVPPMAARLSDLRQSLRRIWSRHKAIVELNAFDDRALRDIGLSRCEIRAAVGCKGAEPCDRGSRR